MDQDFDLFSLPSVDLCSKKDLPPVSCVYFVVDAASVVQYVGKASNLALRWKQHHRFEQLCGMGEIRIYWLSAPVESIGEIEKVFIEKLCPPLNNSEVMYPEGKKTPKQNQIKITLSEKEYQTIAFLVEQGWRRSEADVVIDCLRRALPSVFREWKQQEMFLAMTKYESLTSE